VGIAIKAANVPQARQGSRLEGTNIMEKNADAQFVRICGYSNLPANTQL
jgi:hypothetical protein